MSFQMFAFWQIIRSQARSDGREAERGPEAHEAGGPIHTGEIPEEAFLSVLKIGEG